MNPTRAAIAFALGLLVERHTGIAASWCPLCGPCSCPWKNGEPDRGSDRRCPLHGDNAKHEPDEGAE